MKFDEVSSYRFMVRRGPHLRHFWSAGGDGLGWQWQAASLFEGGQWWHYPTVLRPRWGEKGSPDSLVVLLIQSIGLGRQWFGVASAEASNSRAAMGKNWIGGAWKVLL
jgi:hypothetical protein